LLSLCDGKVGDKLPFLGLGFFDGCLGTFGKRPILAYGFLRYSRGDGVGTVVVSVVSSLSEEEDEPSGIKVKLYKHSYTQVTKPLT
jgi:hypothetical protein